MSKFSIIIPTYNRKDLLKERALKSLLNQTYKDFEVIVINDGGDDVSDVIEEYKDKGLDIKYISYKENKGPSYARNRGIEIAQGEWIGFLDDDDEYLNNTLEIFNSALFNKENKIKSVTGQSIKKINNKILILPPYKNLKIDKKSILQWIVKWWITPGNWVVKKDFLNKLEGFDEKIYIGEDIELGLRILFNINFEEEFIFIPKPVYIHYIGGPIKNNIDKFKKGTIDYSYIIQKHKEKLKENNLLNYFYYRLGTFYQGAGYKKEATKCFLLSFPNLPIHSLLRILLTFLPVSLFLKFEDLLLKLKIKFLR
jgi:glycosyltransferase involved in cell wall biosynthesis